MNPSFHSRWREQLTRFVSFKQALGYSYRRPIATLRSFDRLAAAASARDDFAALLRAWLRRRAARKPASISSELCVIRQFCLFLRRSDPDAFMPGRECAPPSTTGPQFLPYIFTDDEIRRMLDDTAHVSGSLRTRACFRTLIIVLYCTGVRIGEALALTFRDVDLRRRCFRIGPSKSRIRWVPFHADLAGVLKNWMRICGPCHAPDAPFFAQDNGKPRRVKNTGQTLRLLFRRCGLKPKHGREGPRCHDLRHTFAVHRLQLWYRQGRDLPQLLPWLSAYLGHRNLLGTERYLHATPELLATAARRMHRQVFSKKAPP